MASTQGDPSTYTSGNRRSEQGQPRHQTHHHASFPPKCLADLTLTDMDLLAALLLPFKGPESSRAQHDKSLKHRIAALPPHLKANGLTFLSDLCSLHSKLSPFVITNIFHIIRAEVDNDIATFWTPLAQNGHLSHFKCELIRIAQNLSALWLGPELYTQRYGEKPRLSVIKTRKLSSCAACLLTSMADLQTLLALSALLIGRLPESVWPVSKRVQWYEVWIAAFTLDEKDKYRALMWNVGELMRDARMLARQGKPRVDEGGQKVGVRTARLRDVELSPKRPSRPPRSPSQEDDVAFVRQQEAGSEDSEWDEYDDDADVDTAATPSDAPTQDEVPRVRRIASSVYSRAIDADTRSKFFNQQVAHETEVDDILSLYRHSNIFPEDFEIPRFNDDIPPVPPLPTRPPEPLRRKPLPLRDLPPQPMASVMSSSAPQPTVVAEINGTGRAWKM